MVGTSWLILFTADKSDACRSHILLILPSMQLDIRWGHYHDYDQLRSCVLGCIDTYEYKYWLENNDYDPMIDAHKNNWMRQMS